MKGKAIIKTAISLLILVLLVVLLVHSCSDKGAPEVVYDYDIGEAAAMVDEVEWLCAWLQSQDSIPRSDAEALIARLDQTLGFEGKNIVTTALADAADWDDESLDTLPLGNEYIQPTVYHEGVEIVSATETRKCGPLKDGTCGAHVSTLAIRKEYTGDDEALQGWYLEYIFTQRTHDGDWDFTCYNGTYNVEAALPLRDAFYETQY